MPFRLLARKNTRVPFTLNAGVTTITSASYLELVTSLAVASSELFVFNTTNRAILLATGASGAEVAFFALPPATSGADVIAVAIPMELRKGQRISAKALLADATSGSIAINFLG